MIQTLSSPNEKTLIMSIEPKILIPHIVIKENTNGALVSPIPLKIHIVEGTRATATLWEKTHSYIESGHAEQLTLFDQE